MMTVAAATKERMAVDFCDESLYMCMEVFNLDEWEPLLHLASSHLLINDPGTTAHRMRLSLRKVLDHFSAEHNNLDVWALVVAIAMRHRNQLLGERPQLHE